MSIRSFGSGCCLGKIAKMKACRSARICCPPAQADRFGTASAPPVPQDRPFEERYEAFCVAAVTQGTFHYRAAQGRATLAPGAFPLGNPGTHFECGHEHGVGDRCLAFDFDPDYFEEIVASIPGASRLFFTMPRLSPSETLLPVIAAAEAADDDLGFEEAALRVASAAVTAENDASEAVLNLRQERRVAKVVRRIEAEPEEPVTLSRLARDAAMSPYHFLRTFNAVCGVTPYQFVLARRLRLAAVRLRRTTDPISAVAYDAGFNDLSTFNRRFRRVMGMTPGDWRSWQP
jgi:AraC family transcriptional regulator